MRHPVTTGFTDYGPEPPNRETPDSSGSPRIAKRETEEPSRRGGIDQSVTPARGKAFATGFSVLMLVAVLSPLIEHTREIPRDNFPLSYYPMFSARRIGEAEVTYLQGIDALGAGRPLSYELSGPGGLNQSRRQIRRIVQDGRADVLCRDVAKKVALSGKKSLAEVVEVRIVSGRFDLASYFSRVSREPISEEIHASAQVERGRP